MPIDPVYLRTAESLVSRDGGRALLFSGPSKEDKLAMQIIKSEQMISKQKLVQDKLKQQLDMHQ